MNTLLPSDRDDEALPVSGLAVAIGVLVAYGAFAVLISLVAAFANGAHSHQVFSAATWGQLGTGGGVVTGVALFVAWGFGGFAAARVAGREGLRHGAWVFVIGVVVLTVVSAAVTWLPQSSDTLHNLRLLGVPVRRSEWRDVATVAGIASLVGMAAGAVLGGVRGVRAAAPVRVAVPAAAPPPPVAVEEEVPEMVSEPAIVGPSLFEQEEVFEGFEPGPDVFERELEPQFDVAPEPAPAVAPEPTSPVPEPESVPSEPPAWLQFLEERERAIRERDDASTAEQTWQEPESTPTASTEPAPTFIEEPEVEVEPEPAPVTSFWPGEPQREPQSEPEPAPSLDDAWALPGESASGGPADVAFPPSQPTPVGESTAEPDRAIADEVVSPPLQEHTDWPDEAGYHRPPQQAEESKLEEAAEAPPPEPGPSAEELEARRRAQEEAARAYEQARREEQT